LDRAQAGEARVVADRGEVVVGLGWFEQGRTPLDGDAELLERALAVSVTRLDASEVVVDRRQVRLGQRLLENRARRAPVAGVPRR
jgi:hypothetical protein